MAGLACATRLAERGEQVVLFDKGRGPGGRMSARRASVQGETVRFDHGAQYFTARDDRFRKQVQDWQANGNAAPWPAAGENAWVGTPAMNAPIRGMADRLDVEWGARVEAAKRQDQQAGEGWCVRIGERELPSERLVIAVPAEQVSPLLQGAAPDLAKLAQEARSDPCWALMLSFAEQLPVSQDVLRSSEGPISWAASAGWSTPAPNSRARYWKCLRKQPSAKFANGSSPWQPPPRWSQSTRLRIAGGLRR